MTGEGKIKNGVAEKIAFDLADLAANGFRQEKKLPDVKGLADALLQPEEQPERMD